MFPITTPNGAFRCTTIANCSSSSSSKVRRPDLSWITILRKRPAYRAAFARFDPRAVAKFGARDVRRLLADEGIVRNRLKIDAAIANARAFLAVQKRTRQLRSLHLVVQQRTAGAQPLESSRRCSRRDRRVARDEQGVAQARFPLRRSDDLLRLHASRRHGERSPRHLLSPSRAGEALSATRPRQRLKRREGSDRLPEPSRLDVPPPRLCLSRKKTIQELRTRAELVNKILGPRAAHPLWTRKN